MYSYLSAQVEVAEEDGSLRAGDDQDDEDQEEEAKHIVHLMRPAISMVYKKLFFERFDFIWVRKLNLTFIFCFCYHWNS